MAAIPYVEYKHLEPKPLGGTRGKREYRRSARSLRIVGRERCHIYEGACSECGWRFFAKRGEHRKSLHKCRECGFTNTKNKGFWDPSRDRTPPVIPPAQDEYAVELWYVELSYGSLDPRGYYGSKEYAHKHLDDEKYTVHTEPHRVPDVPVDAPQHPADVDTEPPALEERPGQ